MENLARLGNNTLKELLAILLEKSFEAVVITDADPHHHKILYVNPKFCQMTGYSKEELYGQSPGILAGDRTNPQVIKRLKEALLAGQPFVGATTNYRKDGSAYPVQWNIYPVLGENGTPEFFISIQKDLSLLRENLARLKSSSESFRNFLNEIKRQQQQDGTPIGMHNVHHAERNLQENAALLAAFVNVKPISEPDIASALDVDFFDFDDMAQQSETPEEAAELINAEQLFARYDIDAETVQQLGAFPTAMQELLDSCELHNMDTGSLRQFVRELQDLANAVFFLEEFVDVSVSLSELAMTFLYHEKLSLDFLISQAANGLVNDLQLWVREVFIEKTASNIHWLDKSIIGSCKQMIVFINMQSE